MTDRLSDLTAAVIDFRDARDWSQFHTLKDNALSMLIEAGEVAEVVRWKSPTEISHERLGEELSDVLYWVLLTAYDAKIDLGQAFRDKLRKNEELYPIAKASGSARKYDEL